MLLLVGRGHVGPKLRHASVGKGTSAGVLSGSRASDREGELLAGALEHSLDARKLDTDSMQLRRRARLLRDSRDVFELGVDVEEGCGHACLVRACWWYRNSSQLVPCRMTGVRSAYC